MERSISREEIEEKGYQETGCWYPGLAPSEEGIPEKNIIGKFQVVLDEKCETCTVYRIVGWSDQGYTVNEVIILEKFYPKYLEGYFFQSKRSM